MSNWADDAISVTEFVGKTASFMARYGTPALPYAQFIAGFIPGLSPAITVLQLAAPYLQKVATAAPLVEALIKDGKPVIDALQENAPDILHAFKSIIALAINADPKREESGLIAADITNGELSSIFERSFFTPQDPRFDRSAVG